MTAITVLIVDDQDLVRMGMSMVLGQADGITVVGEATNGAAAVERVRSLRPDVVLMDVRMPGMNGIEATAALTEEFPDTAVLILTTFDLDEYALGGLRAGASGFLLKDALATELVQAVRTIAAGDAIVSPRITRHLLQLHRGSMVTVDSSAASQLKALTTREREVFLGMAEGYSNSEIASNMYLSESTVKTYVGRVLAKLGLRDRVHAVIYAYQNRIV